WARRLHSNGRPTRIRRDVFLEKQYKPILSELRKTTGSVKTEPKTEPKQEEEEEEENEDEAAVQFTPDVMSTPKTPAFLQDDDVLEAGPSSPD
ncbi:hypothetical protein J6590_108158, partial [Homalodisca vitripennis]